MADVDESLMNKMNSLRKAFYNSAPNFYNEEQKLLEIIGVDPYSKIAKVLELTLLAAERQSRGVQRDYQDILYYTAALSRGKNGFENFLNLTEENQHILIVSWWSTLHADFETFLSILRLLNNPTIVLISRMPTIDQFIQTETLYQNSKAAQDHLSQSDSTITPRDINRISKNFLNFAMDFANKGPNYPDQCTLTIVALLAILYGESLITEIIVRAENERQAIKVKDLFYFAKDWINLKEYPIQWSLQIDSN